MRSTKKLNLVAVVILLLCLTPLAVFARTYYPQAYPNHYYLNPHQALTVSGRNFAPNEIITIKSSIINTPGNQIRTIANIYGTFTTSVPLRDPYANTNRHFTFTVTSPQSAYPVNFAIQFGTYYPVITPLSYYLRPSQLTTVRGRGFAPSEPIALLINDKIIGESTASPYSDTSFSFITPSQGRTFNLKLLGLWSHTYDERTIYLSP